jgi:hypothetical protein
MRITIVQRLQAAQRITTVLGFGEACWVALVWSVQQRLQALLPGVMTV